MLQYIEKYIKTYCSASANEGFVTQQIFTCSKSTIETLEKVKKYVHS